MTGLMDSTLPQIAVIADVPFPSAVYTGQGITIDKTDPAAWQINLDTMSLPPLPSADVPTSWLAVYDTTASLYERIRLDQLIATATGLDTRTPIGDIPYTVAATDRYVALDTPLTANRIIVLPAANSVPAGREVLLQDECGGLSPSHYWSVQTTGTDRLDGQSIRIISAPYGGLRLRSDGAGNWSAVTTTFVTPISLSYAATAADRVIVAASLAASITVTLPPSSSFPPGERLVVADQSGACSPTHTITVAPSAGDLINGSATPAAALLNGPYLYINLVTDGGGHWTIVGGGATGSISVTSAQISDASPLGRQLLTQTTASADRASLGSGAVGDAVFVATTQAAAQTAMGLNTAATYPIGTSGAQVPLLNGVNTWSGDQTFSAKDIAAASTWLTGQITPPALSANANDYAPSGFANCSVMRLSSTTAVALTGLAGGAAGRIVNIVNVGANNITLTNQSVSSASANQFNLGNNVTLTPQQGVILWYDGTTSCWEALAAPGTGGGAAGALLAANNLSDVNSVPTSRTNLGLGTMATQNATAVAVTGGAVNATPIGATTPASGAFTAMTIGGNTLTVNGGNVTLTRQTGGIAYWSGGNVTGGIGAPFACGRLSRNSASAIQFYPYNGDLILINGAVFQIPGAGIISGNLFSGGVTYVNGVLSNLAATTLYYVYLFNNAGTLTFDFSTTAHAMSTTAGNVGTEIKSGDDTRTLVGMIYTGASAILDTPQNRNLASWFNRLPRQCQNSFTAVRTTSSTTNVEINSEIRINFVNWVDDMPTFGFSGWMYNSVAGASTLGTLGLDATSGGGVGPGFGTAVGSGTNTQTGTIIPQLVNAAEGNHFITILGRVSANTGSWDAYGNYGTLVGSLRS